MHLFIFSPIKTMIHLDFFGMSLCITPMFKQAIHLATCRRTIRYQIQVILVIWSQQKWPGYVSSNHVLVLEHRSMVLPHTFEWLWIERKQSLHSCVITNEQNIFKMRVWVWSHRLTRSRLVQESSPSPRETSMRAPFWTAGLSSAGASTAMDSLVPVTLLIGLPQLPWWGSDQVVKNALYTHHLNETTNIL